MTNQFSDNSDVVWPDKPKVEKDIYKHKANCNQISELGTCPYAQEMSNVMMTNMVKIMPIMMFFIMVSLPGALALYYTVSNLVATAQQHYLLNKDTQEMDEIADEIIENPKTKTTQNKAGQRVKKASEGNITRIKAKG